MAFLDTIPFEVLIIAGQTTIVEFQAICSGTKVTELQNKNSAAGYATIYHNNCDRAAQKICICAVVFHDKIYI